MSQSKLVIKLEELAYLLLSILLFTLLPFAWWVYPVLFFAPDVSLLFLFISKRLGAVVYNIIHHKALAVGLLLVGVLFDLSFLSLAGVILLGHASFDRMLGFGFINAQAETKPAASVSSPVHPTSSKLPAR